MNGIRESHKYTSFRPGGLGVVAIFADARRYLGRPVGGSTGTEATMAGDWLPMRLDLQTDPAVIGMAAQLGVDEDLIVGKLHRFWSWANGQTENGNARVTLPLRSCNDGASPKTWLDGFVGLQGFAEAMIDAGWLTISGGSISIPNFDRWNSKAAKKRILTANRVASYRAKLSSRNSNAGSVTKTLPKERKEENRREEEIPPTPLSECSTGNGNYSDPPVARTALETAAFDFLGTLGNRSPWIVGSIVQEAIATIGEARMIEILAETKDRGKGYKAALAQARSEAGGDGFRAAKEKPAPKRKSFLEREAEKERIALEAEQARKEAGKVFGK